MTPIRGDFTLTFEGKTERGYPMEWELRHISERDGRIIRDALVAAGIPARLVCTESTEVEVA